MGTRLVVAEAVLPGHPDKLCDAIADALVEEAVRRERRALTKPHTIPWRPTWKRRLIELRKSRRILVPRRSTG